MNEVRSRYLPNVIVCIAEGSTGYRVIRKDWADTRYFWVSHMAELPPLTLMVQDGTIFLGGDILMRLCENNDF